MLSQTVRLSKDICDWSSSNHQSLIIDPLTPLTTSLLSTMNKVYHPSTLPLHLLLLSSCHYLLSIHPRLFCNAFSSISPQRHRSPIQHQLHHHPMTTRTSTSFAHHLLLLDNGIHSRAGGGKCSNLCLSTTCLHSSTVSEAGIASTVADDDVTSTSSTTSWIIQWR